MAIETGKAIGAGRRRKLLVAAIFAPFLLLAIGSGGWALYLRLRRLGLEQRLSQLRAEAQAAQQQVSHEDNALRLYRQAFKLHREDALLGELIERWKQQREKFDFRTPEVRRYLAANREFLAGLQKAAGRAKFSFYEDGGRAPWEPAEENRFRGLHHAVDFAIIATGSAAACGQVDRALQLQELMLRIGDHFGSDGALLDILMRSGAQGRAVLGLQRTLNQCSPRFERLERTLTAVETALAQKSDFARTVRLSRLSQMITFAKALHGEPIANMPEDPSVKQYMALLRWSGRGYDEIQEMDRHYTRAAELAGKPVPQALKELQDLSDTVISTFGSDPMAGGRLFTVLDLPARVECLRAVASRRAQLQAARLGIGCRLFKLKTGAYPRNLSQLQTQFPDHFGALPVDPLTGRGYGYRRTKTGCAVWGAGKDGTDEGGDPDSDVVFVLNK
jgi:hypothetical protein